MQLNRLRLGEIENQELDANGSTDPLLEDEMRSAKIMNMMNSIPDEDEDEDNENFQSKNRNQIQDDEEDEDELFNRLLSSNMI